MELITTFEMFAGYGGCSFAFKKAKIPFKCVGYSEIDKYAIQCYNQNHKGVDNFGNCSQIDTDDLPDFDLLSGGFPCQDVSIAGKRDLSKGRTNLFYEIIRIAKVKKPKYMILENVKGLLSMGKKDYITETYFDVIKKELRNIGYDVLYKVLNSKEHGIPQNRERVWIICKYGQWDFMEFQYPEKEKLKIFIKDILEDNVDKKYYLSQKAINKMIEKNKVMNMGGNRLIDSSRDAFSSLACNRSQNDILKITSHSLFPRSSKTNKGGIGHLSKSDGTTYALDTSNCQCIEIPFVYDMYNKKLKTNGLSNCLSNPNHNATRLRISNDCWRRLTPKECFRLMGFLEDEINLEGLSDTQCYKLAGNGWDINVVSKILKRLKWQ